MKIFIVSFLLTCSLSGVVQKRFAFLNPGQSNFVCVAPISVSQASDVKSYASLNNGFSYRWINLPSWATPNGASFTGTPPLGLTGTVPVTVEYSDGREHSGSYTFTLNYDAYSHNSSVNNKFGNLNVVQGISADVASSSSFKSSQMILIPELTSAALATSSSVSNLSSSFLPNQGNNYLPSSSNIRYQTTVTTASNFGNNGINCNLIAANLNNANNQLAVDMNNFTDINNQLTKANTTIINLKINQTSLTNQINTIKIDGISKQNNATMLNQSIETFQINISSVQTQIVNLNAKITQDQSKLGQLQSKKLIYEQQQTINKSKSDAVQLNVTNIQNQLNTLNINIRDFKGKVEEIRIRFQASSKGASQLNTYIDKSNGRVNTAQRELSLAMQEQDLLFKNRTQLISSLSQMNSTLTITQEKLNQFQNQQKILKNNLENANTILKNLQSNISVSQQLSDINMKIVGLQNLISQDQATLLQLQSLLSRYNEQITSFRAQLSVSQSSNSEVQRKLSQYRSQLSALQISIQRQQQNYNKILTQYNSVSFKINQNKEDINKYTRQLEICKSNNRLDATFSQQSDCKEYLPLSQSTSTNIKSLDYSSKYDLRKYNSKYYTPNGYQYSKFSTDLSSCETKSCNCKKCSAGCTSCKGECAVQIPDDLSSLRQSMNDKKKFFQDDFFG